MTQKKAITSSLCTPASQFTSNVPARSPQSSIPQSCPSAASPAKHCLCDRNRQMSRSAWLTVNSFYFSLARSCCVTVSSTFPQPLVSLTATPAMYFHCGNLKAGLSCWLFADLQCTQALQRHEYRSAAKLVTRDVLEKELSWYMWKILAEISRMIDKFYLSKNHLLLWVFQWHGNFWEGFWLSKDNLIFVTPIRYKILHFFSTNFMTQAGRKHKHLNYLWDLPGRLDEEKSRAKPSYGKGNRL